MPSANSPDVCSNLLLTRFLLDRSKRRNFGKATAVSTLEHCKKLLRELIAAWDSYVAGESHVSAEALYTLHLLISTIERLMVRASPGSEDYLCLHDCIILLDEVDLSFERVAATQLSASCKPIAATRDSLRLAG